MTARILVVDDLLPNVKLLEARLSAEYYEVRTATNGPQALALCAEGLCDLVLLDVMMPGMDGFEVCRRLKGNPSTAHIPVVMVTALDQPSDRVRGLEAGADDFLTKPVDEIALLARVRSLARLSVVFDELRSRAKTSASLGLSSASPSATTSVDGANILLIDDRPSSSERITEALSTKNKVMLEPDPNSALFQAAETDWDLCIISLEMRDFDSLRLCSQLRSLERTRNLPLLLIADNDDKQRLVRGLDLGVNDYILRPIDRAELAARVRTQILRKRYADYLRNSMQASLEMAIIDPLTGLNNRRYMESHLRNLMEQSAASGRPCSLMILDIDHFKSVNDTYGHNAGDEVLRGFAIRVKRAIRGVDLLCRLGGEEFVIVMPDTTITTAAQIAERVRGSVEGEPFPIDNGARSLSVTVSIGLSDRGRDTCADHLLNRADQALYRSKAAGRNRVTSAAA